MTESVGVPAWFVGAWKREWIHRRGEEPGEPRIVRDVQTADAFGSVRIPRDRPDLSRATGFADLSDAELGALLDQDGFAGTTTHSGDVVRWRHRIDFQPLGDDDVGRLVPAGPDQVYEHALDGAYVELWSALDRGEPRSDSREREILAVVGDHFVYARRRPVDLPPAPSLRALADGTSREAVLALLDCEVSYGLVQGGAEPWEIRHSTLPWREGRPLGPR